MKLKVSVVILLASILAFSCTREKAGAALATGSSVSFTFSTSATQTRAATPGDGVVADGGGIYIDNTDPENPVPDIVILIANSAGSIVMRYPASGTLEPMDDNTAATIKFDFGAQTEGTYTVYAFANTLGLWDMTTDGSNTITAAGLSNPSVISTAAQVEALYFRPLAANPQLLNERLPLAAKGTVEVSAHKNGVVSLELIRCVAKVQAEMINNTGGQLSFTDYTHTAYGISSDRGYLVEHDPDIPAGAEAGDLVIGPLDVVIPADGYSSLDWYVFPSTGPYTVDVSFTVEGKDYSYTGLPVTDWRSRNIMSLSRNQHLHIVTRISRGLDVSFNFEVGDWTPMAADVHFD